MAKRTGGRRSDQPPIPAVTPATWRDLLVAAAAFGTLAPWTWMYDSELIGLRHPRTGEPLLCSVLGRMRHVFALLVYRRDTGRRWILNTVLNDGDSGGLEEAETVFEQDCVKLEFAPKRDLTDTDRAVLAAAGFVPAAKRGPVWPLVRSFVPGGYPWYPTQAEVELLLYALPRVTAFATLGRDTPGLEVDLGGRGVPFLPADFDPTRQALRVEDLDWQPQIAPPEETPAPLCLEAGQLETFAALPKGKGLRLEVDVFYAPLPVSGEDRPRFPKAAMAVERASGYIAGLELARATDPEGTATLASVLTRALQQLGTRPEAFHVQRPRVAQMVAGLAKSLGILVRQDPELAVLNRAREEMLSRFTR